jgi:hypothetical protein
MTRQNAKLKRKPRNSRNSKVDGKNVFVTLTRLMAEVREGTDFQRREMSLWIAEIAQCGTSKKKRDFCWVCRERFPHDKLEENHAAGKKHDKYRTETLCVSCHREFSNRQQTWDARWWLKAQPGYLREAFLYLGISQMLLQRSAKSGSSFYEKFAWKINNVIAEMLRR